LQRVLLNLNFIELLVFVWFQKHDK